jgi:hypothetical protein
LRRGWLDLGVEARSSLPSAIAPAIHARSGDVPAVVVAAAAMMSMIRRARRISFVKVEWRRCLNQVSRRYAGMMRASVALHFMHQFAER